MLRNIVCAISGGVDSAVAALLLKRKNFNVTGVFMRNWDIADETGTCSVDRDAEDAAYVCQHIGIPFHEINFVKEYWNDVFCQLVDGYEKGTTPNPDVLCNRYIKFGYFFSHATEHLGADAVATGHYARSSAGPFLENLHHCTNGVDLLESADLQKDQTLFLSQMHQSALQRTMFPIGQYKKTYVKQLAREAGLDHILQKRESTGVCFIGKRNFQHFLEQYVEPRPGNFVDLETGQIVGQHNGVHLWTIGQRTRLGGLRLPYCVAARDVLTQTITVVPGSDHPALYSRYFSTDKPHWINGVPAGLQASVPFSCQFRFQHSYPLVDCRLLMKADESFEVELTEPDRALAIGQYAVFHVGDVCLGSASITHVGPTEYQLQRTSSNQHTAADILTSSC